MFNTRFSGREAGKEGEEEEKRERRGKEGREEGRGRNGGREGPRFLLASRGVHVAPSTSLSASSRSQAESRQRLCCWRRGRLP